MTLTEFLLARIAEDETEALRASATIGDGFWLTADRSVRVPRATVAETVVPRHIARHDPARVLAECEAKRRIVAELVPHLEDVEAHAVDGGMFDEDAPHAVHDLLRLLALPYADHPDYRQEWKP